MSPDAESLANEVKRLSEDNGTLTRILRAIEEYVYSGEFLPRGMYALRYIGPCREHFLGLNDDAAQQAVWVDYVHGDDRDDFASAHESAKVTGFLDVKYRLCGADGRLRWVRDRGRVRHAGDRVYLDGSVVDVTVLHEAEQRLTEHVRDIEVLASAHREMALTADPSAARRAVCRAVRAVCSGTGVALFQLDRSNLILVGSEGLDLTHLVLPTSGTSGAARAYRSGERVFVSDAASSEDVSPSLQRATGASSLLFEPVLDGGRRVGVIAVVWNDRLEALPPRVQAMLPLLVTEVAVALERADLVDRLSVAARTDSLTGLPNRRALDDLLPLELRQAASSGKPLCVAVIDLDNFKAYNDGHGHASGDLLLREASQRWRSLLRGSDELIRIGGEEFLVVLPRCDLRDARTLLDAVRRATPFSQSCSIGVALWDGTEPALSLLRRADQAMYAAKHAGRDRVLVATDNADR